MKITKNYIRNLILESLEEAEAGSGKKVFVLEYVIDYEGSDVVGVFESKELALKTQQEKESDPEASSWSSGRYRIREFTLNVTV